MTDIPEGCVNVRNAGSIVDRPLLNTKWMLPNSTIVLSMWFIIRSNSFTVWDISFILTYKPLFSRPFHTSIGIRSDHISLIHLHLTQQLSDLFYGYRRYFSFSISFIQ